MVKNNRNNLIMNNPMRNLLNKKSCMFGKIPIDKLSSMIFSEISKLTYHYENDMYWIVGDKHNLSITDIKRDFGDLTGYEWYCCEIYFDKSLIKHNFCKAIPFILDCLKINLSKQFPNESFCIVVSAQTGHYEHINVHFHLYRKDEFYIDPNIDNYTTPTLLEFM